MTGTPASPPQTWNVRSDETSPPPLFILVVGLPVRDDEARVVVSHLAKTSGEDGGDVVEGLEGGQELVATLGIVDGLRKVLLGGRC